ncbi:MULTISPECIES: DUF2470 domain-containing protein [unclassified Streptomyces]|uniref:DUF2470 domain-containing protein n=1 Tax=unclassified Streptomyces TaxID=2593676 RepID=UPI0006F3DF91|nr:MULTISPECIES: DUF2470 domain-containing protein [unclassified Streptomyces]KQX50741.1 hypothetical protein ASD33_11825 [Streptomyces sp. Root1304]KRA84906.1 hypothetical protein ASE09_11830 [Streptomyces sp. Root66D1]
MRPFSPRTPLPTPAERVRSILAAAHSMTVVSDGLHQEVHLLDGTGPMGHIHLHDPSEESHTGAPARIPVRLEFTDIAPTPVRERLRARVTLTGLLAAPYAPEGAAGLCMEFGQALVEDAEGRNYITLEELQAAEIDPLASSEAALLTHLVDRHGELVPLLMRLVRPRPERDTVRALPVALDRYGITLRLERPTGHHDVRLPFPTPVTDIDQAGPRVHALLAAARRFSHPNRLLT